DGIEIRMNGLEKEMVLIEAKIGAMESRMATKEDLARLAAGMEEKIGTLAAGMATMEAKMEEKIGTLAAGMATMEAKMESNFAGLEDRIVGTLTKMIAVIGSQRTGE
ncbi:MAG TPA: hypothetical protein VKV37_12145, partial [Ktedonobacteraceae bacterium]|nr:hypothetical protein [Ktedonobacteraceae bacterium]